jgi:glycosyltransferase involved in cell wall biosynthesis
MDEMIRRGYKPTFVPTTIDTSIFSADPSPETIPVIGWVGEGAAHRYNLEYFADILRSCIGDLPPFRLRLIGVGSHREGITRAFAFMKDRTDFIDWLKPADVPAAISKFSVGVMPLTADAFNAGKSGLKILEYLAAGIPVIASDVGENTYIVSPPERGLLANTHNEWKEALSQILEDKRPASEMGARGRTFVRERYDRRTVYSAHLRRLSDTMGHGE